MLRIRNPVVQGFGVSTVNPCCIPTTAITSFFECIGSAADCWVSPGAEACDAGSPCPVHVDLIPGLVVGVDILHGLWFHGVGCKGSGFRVRSTTREQAICNLVLGFWRLC